MDMTRRDALTALAVTAGAALAVPAVAGAEAKDKAAPPTAAAARSPHVVRPLPFDPKKLRGISEKMITSHHDNNYAAAVKGLNGVEGQIAVLAADAPGFLVAGLRQSELTFTNSIVNHENYFGNLGGSGELKGALADRIAKEFGSVARFDAEFRALAGGLGGGSGWAVLHLNFHMGRLQIAWSGHHTQSLAFGAPLLVLDMYEHAYQIDYAAAAAKYVEAFFENVNWDEVAARYDRAAAAKLG